MSRFTIKRGDRLPTLRYTLNGADGLPMNLTGATVVFNMRLRSDSSLKVNRGAVTIVTPLSGLVDYAWSATDTNTVGTYDAEFEVTIAGLAMSFPNDSNLVIEIIGDIA